MYETGGFPHGKERNYPTIIDTPRSPDREKRCNERSTEDLRCLHTQEQVDKIFGAAATAADKNAYPLAKMTVEETGMGIMKIRFIKNHYAAEYVYNAYTEHTDM